MVIAATQSMTLFRYWSTLQRRMLWPTPPKAMDEPITRLLTHPDEGTVLASLSAETSSILMLARMLHDDDKKARKAAKAAWDEEGLVDTKGGLFNVSAS